LKNLLIYINPSKEFDKNTEITAKIQIENSLDLGWKIEDILLVTNFPYEYMGVKSTIVDDSYFNESNPTNTKFWAIAHMFWDNLIENNLYWAHDFDCFQLEPISEFEIMEEMDGRDVGICDYGSTHKYSGGSVFFKKSAKIVFMRIREVMEEYGTGEQEAATSLAQNNLTWIVGGMSNPQNRMIPGNFRDSEYIKSRIKTIDFTYNFWHNNLKRRYIGSKKPIRTLHFNVFYNIGKEGNKFDLYSGDNHLGIDFIGDRLTKIFNKYGITRSDERARTD